MAAAGAAIKITLPLVIIQYLDFTATVKHNHVLVSLSVGSVHYETILQRVLISERNLNLWICVIDSLILFKVVIRYK